MSPPPPDVSSSIRALVTVRKSPSAEVMNRLYINVKVDREERPDLDKIYQTAHQFLVQRLEAGEDVDVVTHMRDVASRLACLLIGVNVDPKQAGATYASPVSLVLTSQRRLAMVSS